MGLGLTVRCLEQVYCFLMAFTFNTLQDTVVVVVVVVARRQLLFQLHHGGEVAGWTGLLAGQGCWRGRDGIVEAGSAPLFQSTR